MAYYYYYYYYYYYNLIINTQLCVCFTEGWKTPVKISKETWKV